MRDWSRWGLVAQGLTEDYHVLAGESPRLYTSVSKFGAWSRWHSCSNDIEAAGDFPGSGRQMAVHLHRTPHGGRRPRAAFRAFFRVWGRCRKKGLQRWDAHCAADGVFRFPANL